MAVYSKQSKHNAENVMKKAIEFFGSKPLKLKLQENRNACLWATFEGGGGFVSISAEDKQKGSEVNLETREWDYWAGKFLDEI